MTATDAVTLELLITLPGALIAILLFGPPGRSHDREVYWYLQAVAAFNLVETASLLSIALRHPVSGWAFVGVFGLSAGLVYWRLILLVKGRFDDREGPMVAWLYAALRTGAQALWGILVAQAASHGVTLPGWMQNWFVETVVVAGGIAAVTAAIRWLETRKGGSFGARAARFAAKIVMLGLSGKQPTYATPSTTSSPSAVRLQDGGSMAALRE